MKVWAFGGPKEPEIKRQLFQSVTGGVSRFGYSHLDEDNLLLPEKWQPRPLRPVFLLRIAPGDWIVHINVPNYGECTAVPVVSGYDFDDGAGFGFRHCIGVDPTKRVTFDRNSPCVVPTVNLWPLRRHQRIYAVDDFMVTLDNLRTGKPATLGTKTHDHLRGIVQSIQEFYPRAKLEGFLAKVFRRVPGVKEVVENGGRWERGADLIVTMHQPLGHMELQHCVVVQIKSFRGSHKDAGVNQIRTAIEHYKADAGMLVTTGEPSDKLEQVLKGLSEELEKPIDLLAYTDVASFVLEHAQDLVFPQLGEKSVEARSENS